MRTALVTPGALGDVAFRAESVGELAWEIAQSTDTMRVPPMKGNVVVISYVLFCCKHRISVEAIAKYSLSVRFCFKLQPSLVKCFLAAYNRSVHRGFIKKRKTESYEKPVDDPGGLGSPAARDKQKAVPSPEEKEEKKNRKREALRRRRQET